MWKHQLVRSPLLVNDWNQAETCAIVNQTDPPKLVLDFETNYILLTHPDPHAQTHKQSKDTNKQTNKKKQTNTQTLERHANKQWWQKKPLERMRLGTFNNLYARGVSLTHRIFLALQPLCVDQKGLNHKG